MGLQWLLCIPLMSRLVWKNNGCNWKHQLRVAVPVLSSQDKMAKNWLKMATSDPFFGRGEPPTAPFGEPGRGKLLFVMPSNMQKQLFSFETVC